MNNLRRIGQSRQAEAELLAGLEQWPEARDAFLLQLGFHYKWPDAPAKRSTIFSRRPKPTRSSGHRRRRR